MKIVAFGASNSKSSINKQLAAYAATLAQGAEHEVIDLNDFEMPLFSVDKEAALGHPEQAQQFLDKIGAADAIIISFAEHNGSYSAAYKSLFDWCSRINPKVYQNKPMLVLATSPGGRGGRSVLEQALAQLPRFTADIKASLSVPNFFDNFDTNTNKLINEGLNTALEEAVGQLLAHE